MTVHQSLSSKPTASSSTTYAVDLATQRSIYISSVLAMTVLVFITAGAPCWYAFDLAWGIAIGAMGAIWVGPGFGTMLAGARIALLVDQRAAAAQ